MYPGCCGTETFEKQFSYMFSIADQVKEGGGKKEEGRRRKEDGVMRKEEGVRGKRKQESLLYTYSSHYIKW